VAVAGAALKRKLPERGAFFFDRHILRTEAVMNALALLSSLLFNLVVVVGLVFLVSLAAPRAARWPRPVVRFLLGALFGVAAVVGMLFPVPISVGVVVDSRVPLVSLAALLGGGWSALASVFLVSGFRIAMGGLGWPAGVAAIVSAAAAGHLFRRLVPGAPRNLKWGSFVGLGLVTAGIGLGWSFALAGGQGPSVFQRLWLPIGVFYPLATDLDGVDVGPSARQARR
jgi:hypothetical protein